MALLGLTDICGISRTIQNQRRGAYHGDSPVTVTERP
jgi:hypothetical protein